MNNLLKAENPVHSLVIHALKNVAPIHTSHASSVYAFTSCLKSIVLFL